MHRLASESFTILLVAALIAAPIASRAIAGSIPSNRPLKVRRLLAVADSDCSQLVAADAPDVAPCLAAGQVDGFALIFAAVGKEDRFARVFAIAGRIVAWVSGIAFVRRGGPIDRWALDGHSGLRLSPLRC
jgi:hypothetical protein